MSGKEPFNLPILLLCEGPEDVAFFQALITHRRLPIFHILDTSPEGSRFGGNTRFGERLQALKNFNRGWSNIRHILIVSDNDSDQSESFRMVVTQLREYEFPEPGAPLERTATNPTITVMMLPLADEPGNLETICNPAARNANRQIAGHVDAFVAQVGADRWPQERKGKLWLRASLSARWERDPFVFLGTVFRDTNCCTQLIPLTDPSLTPVADVLEGYRH